jgi:drug/metabolite transporter (DMT)-like permease
LIWTAILILYFVWGSTYLGIKVAIDSIPPFVMGAARFLIAAPVMLVAVYLARRGSLARPTFREVRDCFVVGAMLMGGGLGLVAWGEQTVPSGIAALLIAMMPIWVAVFGRIFLGKRLPRIVAVGIAIGMVGVATLVGPSIAVDRSLDPAGVVALLVSPMSWAAGSLFAANRARLPSDPFVTTGLQMLAGAVVLGLVAVVTGELGEVRLERITSESIAALVYLTVIGSLVAFTAYAWVLRKAPLPLIATYAFVNPVVAVFLGWLVLREQVSPLQLVAGAVIVVGVALIITARNRLTPAASAGQPVARPPSPLDAEPAGGLDAEPAA